MYKNESPNSAIVPKAIEKTQLNRLRDCQPLEPYNIDIIHRVKYVYTLFIKEFPSGFLFPGERHDFWEMVYIVEGDITITEDETVYEMKKGDVIFHKPNEFHSFSVPSKNNCTLLIMSFAIKSDFIDSLSNGVYKLNDNLYDMLMDCYNRISDSFMVDFTYIRKKIVDHSKLYEAMAIMSLENFMLNVIANAKKRERLDNSTSAENYKRIITVLSEHIKEKLTIEDIANYCYMSTFNVKKTFAKYSGCGILQYFNSLKIIRAKELIKQGYTADFISSHLGYSSPSYFSRAFKKETGVSPQKYKSSL